MKRLEIDTRRGAGRPIVLVAFVVAALIITTVWYREGAGGPLHGARRVILAASRPFAIAGTVLTSPFRSLTGYLSDSAVSRADYGALKTQNDQLKARLARLEEARLENERIRELVKFAQAQDYKTLGCRVIGRPSNSWERSIVLDRGTGDGVEVGAAVFAAGGLVGQVTEATRGSAKVRLVTDGSSGVAVMVQRTRAEGVVRGSIEGRLSLDFVGKETLPVKGDVVVTSGMGGVFPKGLVVGDVTEVAAPQADLFPKVTVASRVAIGHIEEVLVMVGSQGVQPAGSAE